MNKRLDENIGINKTNQLIFSKMNPKESRLPLTE